MSALFARNTAFGVVAGIVSSFGRIATTIIVARLLGVHDTGVFNFVLWIAGVALALIDLGMYPALTRYLPEIARQDGVEAATDLAGRLFRPFVLVVLVVLLAFGLVGLWAAFDPELLRRVGLEPSPGLWLLIGLLCASQGLSNFGIGFLQGMQRFHVYAALAVASTMIQLVVCSLGSWFFGVYGAVMGSIAAMVLQSVVSLWLLGRRANVPDGLLKRVFKYSRYAWGSGLAAAFIWARPEVAFVQHFWGSESVGLYSVGYTLASLAAQGPALLCAGLMPYLSENAGPQHHAQVVKMINSGTRLLAFMIMPMCLWTAALVPQLIPLLYGETFSAAAPAATILVSAAILWGNMAVVNAAVAGRERSDFTLAANLSGAILMLAISYFLIPRFGIVGAAAARALATAYLLGISVWFVVKKLDYELPFAQLFKLLVAALASALVAKLTVLALPTVGGLVVAGCAAVISYLVLVRTFRAIPLTDLGRLQSVFDKLPGRHVDLLVPVLVRVLHR